MLLVTINLFGRFHIGYAEQTITGLQPRRAQELLSFLLLHRDRAYPRETLATLLWKEADPTQARKSLRQALWQIQTVLRNAAGTAAKELITLDGDWVRLNSNGALSLDVAVFEHAFQSCRGRPGSDLADTQRENLEHAVQLYRGDLLEGWYQDWCLFERERLRDCYLTALGKLICYCDAHGEVDRGLAYADRILRCDPAEEEAYYHMMHLHWTAGRRVQALRLYRRCKQALSQELGVQPSERTQKLYEHIRSDPFSNAPALLSPLYAPQLDTEPLTKLMAYLKQLQTQLDDLGEQIKRDIRAVAVALKDKH
ncbi:MAG: AfsR/SARP family transcriptional regulator [Gammaproteobacteria bacterium]